MNDTTSTIIENTMSNTETVPMETTQVDNQTTENDTPVTDVSSAQQLLAAFSANPVVPEIVLGAPALIENNSEAISVNGNLGTVISENGITITGDVICDNPQDAITSFDGTRGTITLTNEDIGLNNTSNAPSPISKKKKKNKQAQQPQGDNEELVEKDITHLMNKFNGNKPKNKPTNQNGTSKAVLLVPANRQASSYLKQAFVGGVENTSGDGVDHINISDIAKTDLGKFLDINAKTPFDHPELLHFNSLGGLWYFVKCENNPDVFRGTWGRNNRDIGKTMKFRDVTGFKTIIADAAWVKILSNERAVKDMVESTLPFENYYYQGELRIKKTAPETIWFTIAIEEIRRTLKLRVKSGNMNLMPDFTSIEATPKYNRF